MERILNYAFRSISLRLIVAGIVVSVPVGLSTSWVGAGYQYIMGNTDFVQFVLGLMLSGLPTVFAGGYVLLYPLERWVIRDRAAHSWGWIVARILLYVVAGFPIGWVFLWGMRLGMGRYPAIVESSYFVITVTNVGVVGLLYSFFERALAEIQRREAQLKKQIQELRIEIDEAKRAQKVREITESDYFRELQAKARRMRER
jgi:hypothetical protein